MMASSRYVETSPQRRNSLSVQDMPCIWDSYYGQTMFWAQNLEDSKIEKLINSSEHVSLEEVMDNDEILQECKLENKTLINFLTRPESIEKMIDFVIKEPPDDVDEAVRYKYPNIACELLTCDSDEITNSLVSSEKYLDGLYSFLQTKNGSEVVTESSSGTEENENAKNDDESASGSPLNPLLASFFSKTLSVLLSKRTEIMLNYLKTKKDFVSVLINRIGTSAIMDLWIKLVTCTEDNELHSQIFNWLSSEKAIQKLIECIDPFVPGDRHCNASQTLCEIIRTSREYLSLYQEKAGDDPLLSSIESSEMVSELLSHLLNGERKENVIVNGIAVVLALLEFKKPVSSMQSAPGMQCIVQGKEPGSSDGHPAGDDPNALTALDIERLEKGACQTLSALNSRLQDLHSLLQNPPQKDAMLTTAGSLNPPLGRTRLQVARLVVALIRANVHSINVEIHRLGIVNVLLDLFFEYSYNNLLHTQVEQCLDVILANQPTKENDSEPQNILLNQLLEQLRIVQRILDAWEQNEAEESKANGRRKGYMGHLTKIANHVIFNSENGCNSKVIEKYIQELPEEYSKKWESFVSGPLSDMNKKNTIVPVEIVQNPPSSAEEESPNYIEIAFPHETALQQAFSDYQMQQMTSNFNDHFGFNEEEFADHDASNNIPISISHGVSYNYSSVNDSKCSDVFDQICRHRLPAFDDNGSSDDDIWDDKDQEITFTSDTLRKRTNSNNSNSTGSTDSDEERDSFSDQSPGGTGVVTPGTTQSSSGSDDVKMDVDGWTANFESVKAEETSTAMDIQDIWNSPTNPGGKPDNWANFATFDSDFSCQDPFGMADAADSAKKVSAQMETMETPQPNVVSEEAINANGAISESNQPSTDVSNQTKMDSSSGFKDSFATFPSQVESSNLTDASSVQTSQNTDDLSAKNEPSVKEVEKETSSALPVCIESSQNGPA